MQEIIEDFILSLYFRLFLTNLVF